MRSSSKKHHACRVRRRTPAARWDWCAIAAEARDRLRSADNAQSARRALEHHERREACLTMVAGLTTWTAGDVRAYPPTRAATRYPPARMYSVAVVRSAMTRYANVELQLAGAAGPLDRRGTPDEVAADPRLAGVAENRHCLSWRPCRGSHMLAPCCNCVPTASVAIETCRPNQARRGSARSSARSARRAPPPPSPTRVPTVAVSWSCGLAAPRPRSLATPRRPSGSTGPSARRRPDASCCARRRSALLGYGLIEYVIERSSGMAYADHMREHVFRPLGLSSIGVNRTPDFGDRTAIRYAPNGSAGRARRLRPSRRPGGVLEPPRSRALRDVPR